MKVGDLVRLKALPHLYGIVLEIKPNAWVGKQVSVNWIGDDYMNKYRLFYALDELEVMNEKQV